MHPNFANLLTGSRLPRLALALTFTASLGGCGGPSSAADEQTAARTSPSIARTGKRSRGSNSQEALPGNRYLSDLTGDGVSDLIRFAASTVYVNATDYGLTPILTLDVGRPIKRLVTGAFSGAGRDELCAILDDGSMPCYAIAPDGKSLWWWFTQGAIAGATEDTIVADFDGDGRDDVFVYDRGSGAMHMYAMKGSYFLNAMPQFSTGNLTGLPGGLQFRAGDFGGDGRDDLMMINGAGQVAYYFSLFDGTNNTFWWAFNSAGGVVGANDQVTVARIDDDAADDFVLRDRTSGATRFYHLDWGGGHPTQITNVSVGQINVSANSLIRFAPLRAPISETGGYYRDDAMVFLLGPGALVRSDARWGYAYTYWWAYTFYENPLPVSLFAQETSQWCWAASGQMLMSYAGYPVKQCEQANHAGSRTDCCSTPTPSACVFSGWPDLNYYGFNSTTTTSGTALSWDSLRSEIVNNRRPVAFSWAWSGGGGHMMVAIGAKTVGTSNYVTMNDPWSPNWGGQSDILYSAFVSGSGYSHISDIYNIVHR